MSASGLEKTIDCAVCGAPLVYDTEPTVLACDLCGDERETMIRCPAGHFVCDACHSATALEAAIRALEASSSADPGALLEHVMDHPRLPMHGPEHHGIVAGVIVAAARNAGAAVPEGAIQTAVSRGGKVPGGWCGYYGACGAAIGVGVAVSVLTEATPLEGPQRSQALAATAAALARMVDDQPRCCKRASRTAIDTAIEVLVDQLEIRLDRSDRVACGQSERNAQCPHDACPYFRAERSAIEPA